MKIKNYTSEQAENENLTHEGTSCSSSCLTHNILCSFGLGTFAIKKNAFASQTSLEEDTFFPNFPLDNIIKLEGNF